MARFYTVEGRGDFPHDMLRYDDSVFATDVDRENAGTDYDPVKRRVRLECKVPTLFKPTVERWRSFGWYVVAADTEVARKGREPIRVSGTQGPLAPVVFVLPGTEQDRELTEKVTSRFVTRLSTANDDGDGHAEICTEATAHATAGVSDAEFVRMVCYFEQRDDDPTRYGRWDAERCQRLMPAYHLLLQQRTALADAIRRVAKSYDNESDE